MLYVLFCLSNSRSLLIHVTCNANLSGNECLVDHYLLLKVSYLLNEIDLLSKIHCVQNTKTPFNVVERNFIRNLST